jgi:hypothetical protein
MNVSSNQDIKEDEIITKSTNSPEGAESNTNVSTMDVFNW